MRGSAQCACLAAARTVVRMEPKHPRRWGNYNAANHYSGLSIRLLQDFVKDDLIRSSVVRKPGSKRGVRLIDLRSLDEFIERGVGARNELEMNSNRSGKKEADS